MKNRFNVKKTARAAVIAAIYAALTLALSPISYGMLQVRPSEALIVLCAVDPCAPLGITAGCFIANLLGPGGIVDAVLGTFATFLGAVCASKLKGHRALVPLPNVAFNAVIIGAMLKYVYGQPASLAACMGWVALGELAACCGLGLPLLAVLEKRKDDLGL